MEQHHPSLFYPNFLYNGTQFYAAPPEYEEYEEMDPGLDWDSVQDLMSTDDENFEQTVSTLSMRGLLDLITGLQNSMAEEQHHFDQLTLKLQSHPDPNTVQHKVISNALCESQMRLAMLCSRNMRCFMQQAIRAKEDQKLVARTATQSAEDEEDSYEDSDLSLPSMTHEGHHVTSTQQPIHRDVKSPSDLESNRDLLRRDFTVHHKTSTINTISSFQRKSIHQQNETMLSNGDVINQVKPTIGLSEYQSNGGFPVTSRTSASTLASSGTKAISAASGVVIAVNDTAHKTVKSHVINGRDERESSLSEPEDDDVDDVSGKNGIDVDATNISTLREMIPPSIVVTEDNCSEIDPFHEEFCSNLEISRSSESIHEFECLERKYQEATSDYDSKDFVVHRNTFSDDLLSEDAYSSMNEDNDQDQVDDNSRQEPEIPSPDYGSSEDDDDEGEYQVYHTGSQSGHAHFRQFDDQQDEEDFVDNSASYRSDPRRYMYYPEEKELDTIPEEDEDMDDVNEYGIGYIHQYEEETDQEPEPYEGHREDDITKAVSQTDGDSGVTDDQRSSAAESTEDDDDFDKRSGSVADTDSAQGSMVPDCNSDLSPTFPDKVDDIGEVMSKNPDLFSLETSLGDKKVSGWNTEDGIDEGLADETKECVDAIEESFKAVLEVEPDADGESDSKCSELVESVFNETVIETNKPSEPLPSKSKAESESTATIPNGHKTEETSVPAENSSLPSDTLSDYDETFDDMRRPRSSTLNWDPTQLLKEMYKVEYVTLNGNSDDELYNIEGYLEKMPSGRKKATYWNPWKKRFFRVKDGSLYCYESSQSEKPLMTVQLLGGIIDTMENNMIGIDDRKGHYIAVKCASEEEAELWKAALLHHCCENSSVSYIQPVQYPLPSQKKVIIIDLGSCSTRAGILMDSPTLPQLFFPTVCATDKNTGKQVFGFEALLPDIRKNSVISFPVLPSAKITKYTMNVDALPGLLEKVFHDLKVDPKNYHVQVCVPRSFSLQTQIACVKILLETFGVKSINLTHQAILTLYAYNATSGIVVDIGDRLDILPINEGYIVENGVTRLPYGGQRLSHHLQHALAQKHISLTSDVESYLVRHIIEQSCYVAPNYVEELTRFTNDPDSMEKNISINQYFQGNAPWETIPLDFGRFQAPEGLFNPDLWGLDSPGLHRLVHRAIQECSMDIRREMARSIYVSGGVTLLPGFVERLEMEVDKLTPPSVNPKVHASPYRYHMSYLGACRLASSDGFNQVSVTKDEWTRRGNLCLQKWHL